MRQIPRSLVPGPRVLGSLGPRSSGPGSSVYSVPQPGRICISFTFGQVENAEVETCVPILSRQCHMINIGQYGQLCVLCQLGMSIALSAIITRNKELPIRLLFPLFTLYAEQRS